MVQMKAINLHTEGTEVLKVSTVELTDVPKVMNP